MGKTKSCKNGHIYDNNLNECPYCPSKTVIEGATMADSDGSADETSEDKTEVVSSGDSDRTVIHQPEPETSTSDEAGDATGRKLVGWLVSFTWNKEGQDYQLREGKTLIGAENKCDITVGDGEVSAHHATILYRGEKFRIKDEFSTNGTIINGNEITDQVELNDGDTITVGNTEFLFRSI